AAMGRITTGTGLVSGINSKDIIDQLMKLEARPKDLLQTRVDSANQQKLAFTDLQARLASVKAFGTTMKKPQAITADSTTSTDGRGTPADIDTTAAATLGDALRRINTSLDISFKATDDGDKIALASRSAGPTPASFAVTDLADGHAAEDLGLAGVTAAAGVI